ncbi:MAG: DsbA family protein [Blastocatellia bacterium]
MKKEQKKSNSGVPLVIIVLVLIVAIAGGWWLYAYNTSKPTGNTNTNRATANTQRTPGPPTNAPIGAPVGVNMLGAPNATVTLEEFADYQCGSCAVAHPVMKEIQAAYAGNKNFRFIFRHFPLSIPAHDKAYDAAVATEAAGLQGKFWAMQDMLFRNQQAWSSNPNFRQLWADYATNIGLDVEKFKNDMAGMQTKSRVDADIQRGRGMNVSSTPTVFVNGLAVPYPDVNVQSMRQIIDAELQKAASQAQSAPATPSNTASTTSAGTNTATNKAADKPK